MVSRRGLLGGMTAAAGALLSGCGLRGRSLDAALTDAAEGVDGVISAALEATFDAEFRQLIRGTVETSATDADEVVGIFSQVMSALLHAAYEHGDREEESTRQVGEITASGADGTAYDMWDLRPELEAERGQLDGVLLRDFED